MFDALSDRLERISTRLRGKGRISDEDLDEALKEIRTALLEADVELGVARRFCDGIRLRVSTESLSKSLTPGQQVIKAVHEELIGVLGGETLKLSLRVETTDGRAHGGPPGIGQDDQLGEARPLVEAAGPQPAPRRRRPAAPGGRRAAARARRPDRRDRLLGADRSRPLREGRGGRSAAARQRHLHHRHRGPAHHRRRAHGADP